MTPIVFLRLSDTRREGGTVEAVHSLDHGYLRAGLAAAGIAAQQFVDPAPGTLARLARRLRETRATTFVFALEADTEELARACARALDGSQVIWSNGLESSLDLPLDDLPSPYLSGAVPPAVAHRVGAKIGRQVVEELAFVSERSVEPQVVPLVGEVSASLCAAIAEAQLRRVRPSATLDAATTDVQLVARLAAAGFAAVRLRVRSEVGSLSTLADAAAAHELELTAHLELDATAPLEDTEDLIIAVAETGVPFDHEWLGGAEPAGLAVPELQASATFAREMAARRRLVARLRRSQEGFYPPAAFAESVCELVWLHPDPPARHEAWLAEIVGFESALFPVGAGTDAWAPSETATVENLGAAWRIDDTEIALERYSVVRDTVPAGPLVALVDERADVEAFLADADDARRNGVFRPAFCHPLSTIRDLARWTGDAAPLTLPRLVVDSGGNVRAAHAGATLGCIGDSFAVLRAEARDRVQSFALPEWLTLETHAEWLRQRPWLRRYIAVALAVRTLTGRHPELLTREGLASLRVSGFGGPLVYDGTLPDEPPHTPLLVAVGGERYLFDVQTARVARCAPDLAAIFEAMAAGDLALPRDWLERKRSLSAEQALRGVLAAAAQLQSAGMLSADLQTTLAEVAA